MLLACKRQRPTPQKASCEMINEASRAGPHEVVRVEVRRLWSKEVLSMQASQRWGSLLGPCMSLPRNNPGVVL